MVPGNHSNTWVCCSTETPQTHTMSLFNPKQMPPNKEMHPAPTTISQVSPYLILPCYIIFCLQHNSEFLWGWRQHNMLQLLITSYNTAVRLYVMKSSPALTPISGTDSLCKFLLMPCHFIPFPSLFSSYFKDHVKFLRRQQLGVLQLLHFKWIIWSFWLYYKIINMTINQGKRERG